MLDALFWGMKNSPVAWTSFMGGLGISKLHFLIKNYQFLAVNFFQFSDHQNPGSRSGSALTKNAGSGSALISMRIHNTGHNKERMKRGLLFYKVRVPASGPHVWKWWGEAGILSQVHSRQGKAAQHLKRCSVQFLIFYYFIRNFWQKMIVILYAEIQNMPKDMAFSYLNVQLLESIP